MKKTSILFSLAIFAVTVDANPPKRVFPSTNSAFGINNTEGLIPGDTNNGIAGLKNIESYINIYSYNHKGNTPDQMSTLVSDILTDKIRYGLKTDSEIFSKLSNKDSEFADDPGLAQNPVYSIPYYVANVRPDGTPISSPKMKGQRDAMSWTKIYFYENAYHSRSRTRILNPVGYWIVLWDDLKIDRVPYDRIIYIRSKQGFYAVPDQQAGVNENSTTYSEYWTQLRNAEIPPIGKPLPQKSDEYIEDNGGPESLVHLSRRQNFPDIYGIAREALWKQFDPAQPEFTLSDIQAGAKKLGLDTQVEKQSLSQLQQSGSPALLFLKDDGRIVTLTALDANRAVVIDRGLTHNIERSVLEGRYSGEALVPAKALMQSAGSVADDAVRSVQLPSLDTEVPQTFTLRNTGKMPLTLQLEYPMLGVTDSNLSKDTLAPGETATLDLKVKWRSILKAPTQNVLVSIQTSDPIVPRLQLAILLNPPKTAEAK